MTLTQERGTATSAAPPTTTTPATPANPETPAGTPSTVGLTVTAALAVLLAAQSLRALLDGGQWELPVLAAIAVAAVSGELGRRFRAPAVVLPLLTPVGLLLLLTGVGAAHTAWLGVIPRSGTFPALGDLVRHGLDDISTYVPPAPATHGLQLLAAAGVFAVAALTDLVAVTLRRPALAVVPLASLVVVAAAVRRDGVGSIAVGAAVLGWLVLLAVDGRLREREWGRPLAAQAGGGPALIGGAGGRIATVALAGGLLLPVVLQPPGDNLFHREPSLSGQGDEVGGERQIGPPLVTVRTRLRDPRTYPVLTWTTARPGYLRLTSLDAVDRYRFTLSRDQGDAPTRVDGDLGSDPGVGQSVRVTSTITITPQLDDALLPVPYSPVSARISANRWVLSDRLRSIFSVRGSTAGVSVSVTSDVPSPTASRLRATEGIADVRDVGVTPLTRRQLTEDLSLPGDLPASVRTTALQVTRGAPTRYDRMLALQRWFTDRSVGRFTYDLSAQVPEGVAGLVTFLRDRQGYCEQFASAFAIMARTLGVPTRVAVGFTAGTEQEDGSRRVTNHDAHAWPEVFFPGQGWVRFEPTPRSDTATTQPDYAQTRPLPRPSTPSSAPSIAAPSEGAGASRSATPRDPSQADRGAGGTTGSGSASGQVARFGVLGLVAVALALLPGSAAALARRRRRRHAAAGSDDAAWREAGAVADDLRQGLPAHLTPRAAGRRLTALIDPADEAGLAAVAAVVRHREQTAYARPAERDAVSSATLAQLRRSCLAGLSRGRRATVWLLPASLVTQVRDAGQAVVEVAERSGEALLGRVFRPLRRS